MLSCSKWILPALLTFFPVVGVATEEMHPLPLFAGETREGSEKKEGYFEQFSDNSFFIEEAYNQEAGVVQSIFAAGYFKDDEAGVRSRSWELFFSQEWPLFSQDHQFALSVPYSFTDVTEDGVQDKQNGVGDVTLQYRYQLLYENQYRPAFAPAFTLSLPTGDEERGLGTGAIGYVFNLPLTKVIWPRVQLNLNLGIGFFPDSRVLLSDDTLSAKFDLVNYKLAGSAIVALTENVHFLLETLWLSNNAAEEFEDADGNGVSTVHRFYQNEVTVSPGLRFAIDLPWNLQIVPGVGVPIGISHNAVDLGVFMYLSFEHPFLPSLFKQTERS